MDLTNLRMAIPSRRHLYGGGTSRAVGHPLTGRTRRRKSLDPNEGGGGLLSSALERKFLSFRLRYGQLQLSVHGFRTASQVKALQGKKIESVFDVESSVVVSGRAQEIKDLIAKFITNSQT
jgi:hypothetical protein